jgi:hypothetical protein
MENVVLSPELLASVAGILLSLAFSYIPGLRVKWAAVEPDKQRLIMLGLVVLVAGAIFGLGCANWVVVNLACDQSGIQKLVGIIILALIANQSVYAISPLPADVKDAKFI